MEEQNLIPQLRFAEFTEEWVEKKAGELCDFIVPGRNKPKIFNGTIPWVTTPDLKNTLTIEKSKSNLAISKIEAKKVGAKIVPKGSIIMSCVGELGIVAKVNNDIIINQQLHAFIPKKELNNWFLLYQLNIRQRYMEKVATKTAVPYMNKDNCNSIPIVFPKIEEQTKIATFLTAVDKRINLLQKKKTELEQYKKGVMQKIFVLNHDYKDLHNDPDFKNQGNQNNQEKSRFRQLRFKQDDGSDFEDWEVKKLGEVENLKHGDGDWILSKNIGINEKYSVIQLGNIGMGKFIDKKLKTISDKNFQIVKGTLINKGDILINRMVDKDINVCVFPYSGNYITSVDVCWIRKGDNINNEFFTFLLQDRKSQKKLLSLSSGSGRVRISKKNLFEKFKFKLPSIPEQQKIANFLSSIDESITNCELRITNMQEWKKGLLQKMFV